MNMMFADVDESPPPIEVVGEFSFLESDAESTDREFAALVTSTRARVDVVPQQGSAVASVATLMPSDHQDAAELNAVNEFASLLIDPLDAPAPDASGGKSEAAGPSVDPS
jgi:hypothetical protein